MPVTDDLKHDLICRAAQAAETRPHFLAAVLARYRAIEQIDDAVLARHLGMSPDHLCVLALCGRPRQTTFRDDVDAIATRFAIQPARLATLIRQVEALDALSADHAAPGSLLAAARDADEHQAKSIDAEDDEP
jgi:hypothetical protein